MTNNSLSKKKYNINKKRTLKKRKTDLKLVKNERFNKLDGIYNSLNECNKNTNNNKKPYPITNNKFTSSRIRFDHMYYHAGDWNDIERYGLLPIRTYVPSNNNLKLLPPLSSIYKNYNFESIYNTFKYIFYHLKKGVFVSIRDSKLNVFLPFSNAKYVNTFMDRLYFDKEDSELLNNIKKTLKENKNIKDLNEKAEKRVEEFEKSTGFKNIEKKRYKWVLNNCNIRASSKGNIEGEHGLNIYKDLLIQLCENVKNLPDCDFFLNVRDFPILREDMREPYHHLFDNTPNYIPKQYQNKPFAPIFSASKTNDFADILMPTIDDWSRVSNKYYLDWKKGCYASKEINKNIKWEDKINKVIFRGSATGCGITVNTNIRLKAAVLGEKHPDIFDIGIVDWNARLKKYTKKAVQVIDKDSINISLKQKITDEEKFKYKYILYLDGHVSAFRLGGEMASGSVLFIPESPYSLWFSELLKPMVHYIPIKSDLTDLVEKTNFCINNDKLSKKIAMNAKKFYNDNLNKQKILEYMGNRIKDISSINASDYKTEYDKLINIALITIFRESEDGNRGIQKDHFLEIMPKLFKGVAKLSIFIVEQNKDDMFNIGKLKNIGFDLAKKSNIEFSHFIFTDIDAIPDTELFKYYIEKPKYPTALAIDGTRYYSRKSEDKKPFIGGVCSFTKTQFEKINGYSNSFYGWGGEDTNLALRINEQNMTIGYPKKGSIIDIEEENNNSINLKDKVQIQLKDKRDKLAYEKMYIVKSNGLSNLNYKIINTYNLKEKNLSITQVVVDLLRNTDETEYEEWFPKKFNEHELSKYKKYMKNIIWNIKEV
tara:strand:+ start:1142 stop:3613 length:2472 start_codon:yes stop_codon:yes gene_type:complete